MPCKRRNQQFAGHLQVHNPIESIISIARDVTGNVTRWKNGKMVVRWMAATLLDAEKRFRRALVGEPNCAGHRGYSADSHPRRTSSTDTEIRVHEGRSVVERRRHT